METLRIALAQINPTVGDLKGNTEKIIEYIEKATASEADIVVFPELSITGYPPEDLLLNKSFLKDTRKYLGRVVPHTKEILAVLGCVEVKNKGIYNAAAVVANGKLVDVYRKANLERQSVFDDTRYFQQGKGHQLYRLNGINFAITIGEEVLRTQPSDNTQLIINIDASPYCVGSNTQKEKALSRKAVENHAFIAHTNMVGGQDEVVLNGESLIVNREGRIIAKGAPFDEDLVVADVEFKTTIKKNNIETIEISLEPKQTRKPIKKRTIKNLEPLEMIYRALVLGTRDYVRKNGFKKVVLGLSGGIDSSLVAVIAHDAVGKDNVTGIFMPTRYTSKESKEDAYLLVKNLTINITEAPIDSLFEAYLNVLKTHFKGSYVHLTEENIQPRIRANILMAFSNNFGWLVLTTGNKSEVSTGYSTLYGDTAGGLAVLSDVTKTMVYKIATWQNKKAGHPLILERVLKKAPSAELKHGQKDTDTLPPYEILDPIIKAYIEDNKTLDEISVMGYDRGLVREVMGRVDHNEYKRRQCPIGIKITKKSFGKDRTFPITNKYRHT
jgi:NAD+ synthase (glutamine-hydrolysing)